MSATDKHGTHYPLTPPGTAYARQPADPQTHRPERVHWSLDDIHYDAIDPTRIVDNPYLFYMLAAASLVEINSDLYTHNLLEYFDGDTDVTDWLARNWQHEEITLEPVNREFLPIVLSAKEEGDVEVAAEFVGALR